MITVHHLEDSRSQRILWMLEELELDYQVRRYERDQTTMLAPDSLREVHPLGRSPVITHSKEGQNITVAESGAIIEHLSDAAGGSLRPAAGEALRDYRYWLHFAEGSLMPYLLLNLVFTRLPEPPMPWPMRLPAGLIGKGVRQQFVEPRLEGIFRYTDDYLANRRWFAGDELTGADIQMSFPLEAARARDLIGEDFAAIGKFVQRVHERPATSVRWSEAATMPTLDQKA